MVTTVNVHEAKSTLSRLLERVEAGETVVIARAGKPVAELVPHRRVDMVFGLAKGRLEYDPDTFDDPDEEIIADFEGG
jgi:prevent-host-death family protein